MQTVLGVFMFGLLRVMNSWPTLPPGVLQIASPPRILRLLLEAKARKDGATALYSTWFRFWDRILSRFGRRSRTWMARPPWRSLQPEEMFRNLAKNQASRPPLLVIPMGSPGPPKNAKDAAVLHIDVLFPFVGWLIEGFVYPFNR